ncbi:MAG: hypothetical protein QW128_07985 [Thermoprotei archaeon]
MEMIKDVKKLIELIKKHDEWREEKTINLIPSENIVSPEVRAFLSSKIVGRYTSRDSFYRGTKYIDEIEELGVEIAKRVFKAKYADLRMISGHIADFTFIMAYVKRGETIMCIDPKDGGYPGISKNALPKLLGIRVEYLQFNKDNYTIDIEKSIERIREVKPKAIILGSSLILSHQPVREISSMANKIGAVVGYDGSHVLGLIAGHTFQDPLREGATALFGSTHKTFFGPQGGIMLANEPEPLNSIVHPSIVDNAHWNRIAALTMALLEIEKFGDTYAKQVIKNAKALAKSLAERKMPVKGPKDVYTESHQVLFAPRPYQHNKKLALKLEKANIIVDSGIRLGVNEVTRRGMKEGEMDRIAEFIERVFNGENPKKIAIEVSKLRTEFSGIEYRFKDIIDLNYFIS